MAGIKVLSACRRTGRGWRRTRTSDSRRRPGCRWCRSRWRRCRWCGRSRPWRLQWWLRWEIFKNSREASFFMCCYFLLTLNLIVTCKGLLESTAGPGENNINKTKVLKNQTFLLGGSLDWVEGAADGCDEQGDSHGDLEDQRGLVGSERGLGLYGLLIFTSLQFLRTFQTIIENKSIKCTVFMGACDTFMKCRASRA